MKKILLTLATLLIAHSALANTHYTFVKRLNEQVHNQFHCGHHSPILQYNLNTLLANKILMLRICERTSLPHECIKGAFSISNETQGLISLNHKKTGAHMCQMAAETQHQLEFYLQSYLFHPLH
tara:strand:- start:3252 stop:3623 length:372 start_codon:yes stop_codon:yes gene_type:complete